MALRCDASIAVGVGHVSRCLALAEVASQRGWRIELLGQIDGVPWFEEMASWIPRTPVEVGFTKRYDLLVLDSYHLNEIEVRALKSVSKTTLAIVDSDGPAVEADFYLHHGVFDRINQNQSTPKAIHFTGLSNLLISKRFRDIKLDSSPRVDTSTRVFIAFGGTDSTGTTSLITDACLRARNPCHFDVISGVPLHLSQVLPEHHTLTVHAPSGLSSQLAKDADLVIGGAGVSSFEWLYLNTPMALLQIADNQSRNYEFLTKNGLALGLGDSAVHDHFESDELIALIGNPEARKLFRRRMRGLVDGLGAERVLDTVTDYLHSRTLS